MCLALIFLLAAAEMVVDWQGAEQALTQALCDMLGKMPEGGDFRNALEEVVPWSHVLLGVAALFEIVGGLMVFLGIKVRAGSVLLMLFLIPTTWVFHRFWQLTGAEQDLQLVMFLKNLAIFGGLLTLCVFGKGTVEPKGGEAPAGR
jgi:uncharacterized membrane protein YphA (DoxX/SURF4 family)